MEPNNNKTSSVIPAYIIFANKANQTYSWVRNTALPWLVGIGLASGGLSYGAWLIRLQVGAGIFYGYAAISTILFAWAVHTALQMIKFEQTGGIVDNQTRWLVFGKLFSACFSVIAVATIGFLEPSFSFLSHDLSIVGVSVGPNKKMAEKAKKGELPPEAIGLATVEGVTSVGLSGFEGVENHEQMRAHKVSNSNNSNNFSSAYSPEVLKQMHYRYFIRVFKEREGFNPKIYWDKTQWSIGYGSFANDLKKKSPNMTVTKDQAYDLALKELDVCRNKARADFDWLSPEQELVITDLYYNAGKHSITGLAGQRKAGTLLPVLKKYHNDPTSISYDQLYSAFVEAKDCGDCDKGKRCGHQERRRLNVLQFLSQRNAKDFAAWKQAYDKVTGTPTKSIAGL